jgi:hypothetical protein
VAPMITGMTKYFMFHIRWISILKFLYFNSFSDSFCITFLSDDIATSISKQILYFFFLLLLLLLHTLIIIIIMKNLIIIIDVLIMLSDCIKVLVLC